MELKYVPTTCPYCGTGCGINLVVKDKKVVGVAPWHRNPVNDGKLCPKGNYAWEFVNSPDRLTTPLIKKDGKFVEASWDEAYKLIASKFKSYKPEEMACLSSARVSNEENYLMQKFARAVLKTPNIDHCARLCHASTVVGLAGAFGSGAMTQSIADIAESKCLLVIGTNTFEQHPLIGRRIMQAKKNGAKIIYADPRLTPTGKQADLYLQFYSGTDVALLNCFMHQILKNGWEDKEFIEKRTKDFEKVKEIVSKDAYSPENVAKITGDSRKGHHHRGRVVLQIRPVSDPVLDGYHPAHHRCRQRQVGRQPPDADRQPRKARHGHLCTAWPEQRAGRLRHGSPCKRVLRVPVGHRPRHEEEDGDRMGLRDC